jgi:hypothetical protein
MHNVASLSVQIGEIEKTDKIKLINANENYEDSSMN